MGSWGKLILLAGRKSTLSDSETKVHVPADPQLLELDLRGWAGERIANGGRKDALLGRVESLHLSLDGRTVEARVRGNRPLPYHVRVWLEDGPPRSDCTCSGESTVACRHAVASIEALRFPIPKRPRTTGRRRSGRVGRGVGRIKRPVCRSAGFVILGDAERTRTREERLGEAREEEILARRQSARKERTKVTLVEPDGGPLSFIVSPRRAGPAAAVRLRGDLKTGWSCDCIDFSENELGTCKHVERVRRRRGLAKLRTDRHLSVWAKPREWPERSPEPLGEMRIDLPLEMLPRSLASFFDDEGWLRPDPDDGALSEWARAACATASRVAHRRGWVFDLDTRLEFIIAERADAELHQARLERAVGDEKLWSEVLGGLDITLHRYQEEGVRFLASRGRAFLADDMGLGKTIQAVAAALVLRRSVGSKKVLIVCPASLKHQWRSEIQKVCGENAAVVEGARSSRVAAYAGWDEGFLILNYELVLRDLGAIQAAGADLIVLDEAQRIKNWETKTARSVKRLRSRYAFILTGTPLENRLMELHSLAEYLNPRALGPRWRLLPFHAVTESRGRVVAYEGLDVLRRRLAWFFLRRERANVLDELPERTDNTFWTGMTAAQRRPYKKHSAVAAALLAQNRPLHPPEVRAMLRALTAMRILCNAYAQYEWELFESSILGGPSLEPGELRSLFSPKLEEFAKVMEDLLDASEQKIVVFSQWLRMLRLARHALGRSLGQRDLRAELFHGGLNGRDRGTMLDAFRSDPEFRVLFSTDAGGVGLNLQDAASIVVNLEVPWNPAVLEQRIGRVHRIGQKRSVQVLHFVTKGAIEERVRQVVESKRALFDGLISGRADQVILDESERTSFVSRMRGLIGDDDGKPVG